MVDTFTREEFEIALPKGKDGGQLWESAGLLDGEYCYTVQVSPHCHIFVRSSIDKDGFSAPSGEDSIRCWLVGADKKTPVGGKLSRWTTRQPGWEKRLLEILRRMYRLGRYVRPCDCGNGMRVIRKVKKPGPNQGRLFVACTGCGYFDWRDEKE